LVTISSNLKWFNTVRFKLFIVLFVVGIIPLLLFAGYMRHTILEYFKTTNEKEMLYEANKIAGSIQKADYLTDSTKQDQFISSLQAKAGEENWRIIVVDKYAYVLADTNLSTEGSVLVIPEILVALNGTDEANLHTENANGGAIYASAYIEDDNSEKIGAVLIVSPYGGIATPLNDINSRLLLTTILLTAVVSALVFFSSKILFEPLNGILDTMKKIASGQFHQRIDVKGNNEFSQLGEAVNNMTTRLEQVDNSRQEFVSNVSHELKTPLSSIKVLTESILLQQNVPEEMYREFLVDINSEIDRMTAIVNDLLSLVRLDYNGAKLNIDEIDMNRMLRDIVKRLNPLAENKNIELSYESSKEVTVEGDEVKLSLAISNLVENGIKYTPMDGKVKVSIDADHLDCFITVQDTGIGISEEEQTKVFDRFYRVDKTRDRETGGTGLGLAITHSTVLLHNGSVKVISGEGKGSTFVVRLPLKHEEV